MKKLFAILLCIAMMLSMVACGDNQDNNETPNTTQNSNQNNNSTPANVTIVKDVLLKREIVEVDHLGNTTSTYYNEWTYNTDGTVHSAPWDGFESGTLLWRRMLISQVETNPGQVGISTPQFYVYNADGQVEKIEYKADEEATVEAVRNFTYDENRVVSEKIIYADGREESVGYTYDSNGMVIQMEHTTGNPRHRFKQVYTYEYNDQGKVVKETISEETEDYNNEGTYEVYATTVLAYTYDSNGHLASAETTNRYGSGNDFEIRTDNWTYTCSETGRLLNIYISCGNVVWESTGQDTGMNSPVAGVKITFHYGDYYVNNPAN